MNVRVQVCVASAFLHVQVCMVLVVNRRAAAAAFHITYSLMYDSYTTANCRRRCCNDIEEYERHQTV